MDEYLECLMDYVEETRVGKLLRTQERYRKSLQKASDAYEELSAKLPPEQLATLEEFRDAHNSMNAVHSEIVFQQGVAVGKWMRG